MQLLPVDRGHMKVNFKDPSTEEIYATLNVVALVADQSPSHTMLRLVPVVIDDTLYTASDYAFQYKKGEDAAPLAWEVFEALPDEEDPDGAPRWFQRFFEAYLDGTALDFNGAKIPSWLKWRLQAAVESGAIARVVERRAVAGTTEGGRPLNNQVKYTHDYLHPAGYVESGRAGLEWERGGGG